MRANVFHFCHASSNQLALGKKFNEYDVCNYLGDTLTCLSATQTPKEVHSYIVGDYCFSSIKSAQDYYSFGMLMPGRKYATATYRFGFNGKENDGEVKGEGNQQDYGKRVFDPRLAKFLSADPLAPKYPFYTPYQFAGNKPVIAIDLDGLEEYLVIRWMIGKTNVSTGTTLIRIPLDCRVERDNSRSAVYIMRDANDLVRYIKTDKDGNSTLDATSLVGDYLCTGQSYKSTLDKTSSKWSDELDPELKSVMEEGYGNYLKATKRPGSDPNAKGFALNIEEAKPQDITFENNSATLTKKGKSELNKLYIKMLLMPKTNFELIGHTDNVGDDASNVTLSANRALAAKNYLVSKGIDPSRLQTSGKGESSPIDDNNTEKGRAMNRRIEIKKSK